MPIQRDCQNQGGIKPRALVGPESYVRDRNLSFRKWKVDRVSIYARKTALKKIIERQGVENTVEVDHSEMKLQQHQGDLNPMYGEYCIS